MFIITFDKNEAPTALADQILLYHHVENFKKDLRNGTIITDDILADINDMLHENYSTVEELVKEEGDYIFEMWFYYEEIKFSDEE